MTESYPSSCQNYRPERGPDLQFLYLYNRNRLDLFSEARYQTLGIDEVDLISRLGSRKIEGL